MAEKVNKVYAFIADGDVFATIHIAPTSANYDRIVAGLSSNPIIIDATDVPDVRFGWTFDGTSFIAPGE